MVQVGDPVRAGLVASLAHPGGNVTGTSFLGPDLAPKRLQLLKQIIPLAVRVAL
jgi:putative ABC transport system substrate-binding protein